MPILRDEIGRGLFTVETGNLRCDPEVSGNLDGDVPRPVDTGVGPGGAAGADENRDFRFERLVHQDLEVSLDGLPVHFRDAPRKIRGPAVGRPRIRRDNVGAGCNTVADVLPLKAGAEHTGRNQNGDVARSSICLYHISCLPVPPHHQTHCLPRRHGIEDRVHWHSV